MIVAVALQPDFEAFFGAVEAVIAASSVLLAVLVVVTIVKRLFKAST